MAPLFPDVMCSYVYLSALRDPQAADRYDGNPQAHVHAQFRSTFDQKYSGNWLVMNNQFSEYP